MFPHAQRFCTAQWHDYLQMLLTPGLSYLYFAFENHLPGEIKWNDLCRMNQIEVAKNFIKQGVCGQCCQSWLSLRGKEEAQALPPRRSRFSLAGAMNTPETIRKFYGHSYPSAVLLSAQHPNLLSVFEEFSVWEILMRNSLCPALEV